MATSNQNKAKENAIRQAEVQEKERSNRAKEQEDRRSNMAREGETERANRAAERNKKREMYLNTIVGAGRIAAAANDPSWYNKDPQLVKDVASFTFGQPLGTEENLGEETPFPGVMRIGWTPTVGPNMSQSNKAVDQMARELTAWIRKANSGSKNYDPNDYMLHLLAIDEAITLWAEGVRLYSVCMTYKLENRYWAKGIATALVNNQDPSNFMDNLAQFRAILNRMAVALNAFAIPDNIPLFKRHNWLATQIFKDQPVKKSQNYVFCRDSWANFDDVGGALVYNAGNPWTSVADFNNVANAILSSLLNSEDIAIMSGDTLKAFGDRSLLTIPTIEEDYHIEAVYSPEVLTQINGATIVTIQPFTSGASGTYSIYSEPTTGSIVGAYTSGTGTDLTKTSDVCVSFGNTANLPASPSVFAARKRDKFLFNRYVNMYKDDVTPDDVMVATRFTVSGYQVAATAGTNTSVYCGTEVVTSVAIFSYSLLTSGGVSQTINRVQLTTTFNQFPPASSGELNFYNYLGRAAKFDWAPRLGLFRTTAGQNGYFQAYYLDDTANTAIIEPNNLLAMHEVAALSLFGVPGLFKSGR